MEILLFGIAKDIVGKSKIQFSPQGETPGSVLELKRILSDSYPEFSKLSSLAVAVNSEYATDGTLLENSDEIAIIPPVSGG